MNPFTNMNDALTARGTQRGARPRGLIKAGGKPNKTLALRDYLRDTGPATAVVLADEVGLDRVDLVSALLGKDLILGRVYREAPCTTSTTNTPTPCGRTKKTWPAACAWLAGRQHRPPRERTARDRSPNRSPGA